MSFEYQPSSEENAEENCEDFQPKKKRQTKNEQIYGDFFEAYDPQPEPSVFQKPTSYSKFKAGATIETYSSDVEVTLPISKPKPKIDKKNIQEEEQEKPMLGQFTLNSFLNQLGGGNQLNDIDEEENQDSIATTPEGLNEKILQTLELVKTGEEQVDEQIDFDNLTFEKYMQIGKPKVEQKYKTEEEKEIAKDYKSNYGVGFKMLEKMGFKNITKGLGKDETGRQKPVEANRKNAFTMKDDTHTTRKEESQSQVEEQVEPELSIPEQLFKYHSKNPKINNFLLDVQRKYEKLNSQIYFIENQSLSMQKKLEISLSIQAQEQNQANQLKEEINKLEIISSSLERCIEYPHLGEHYQIDLLFVKKVHDKFRLNNFEFLHQNAGKELVNLKSALNKFYLAKSKQSLRMFEMTTAIEQKIHKNLKKKKHKKDSNIIDLDNLSDEEDEVQMVQIGVDEEQKIKKFIDFLINKSLVPAIEDILIRSSSLDKVKDERVIDLIDVVRKFDSKQKTIKQIVNNQLLPLYQNYLRKMNLDQLQDEKAKVLPHLVIMPWLHLLQVSEKFNLNRFYRIIAKKLWNLESSVLFNIVAPFRKFSSAKDISFFTNLCLAPRLQYLLQSFSISNPNPGLLNGFTKYSQMLRQDIKDEILENTLFLEVEQVYRKYTIQREPKEVAKWLKGWQKFSDKISPGKFSQFFQQIYANS